MSFLQPGLLFLLPLAALPIVIHLLHQRRYRTVPWAAMMFLLDAKRQSRGMARLRHYLILAMRVLSILGLIFAISRPLASGTVGWAIGGAPDTIMILLDRSGSMEQQDLTTGESKRSTALAKLAELLGRTSKGSKIVLVESTRLEPQEMEAASNLVNMPDTEGTGTSADISAMMQVALEYINENQTGRTDVWVCSDLAENDWKPESGRWDGVRQGFEGLEGVRFYLLTYTNPAKGNYGVTVDGVERRKLDGRSELVLDIRINRSADLSKAITMPLEIVVEGNRMAVEVEISKDQYVLQGHTIPIDDRLVEGWGSVSLPNDSNPTDNTFYFVFADEPIRQTVIVTDDALLADTFRMAATAPSDPNLQFSADILSTARANEIPWETAGLIVWHANLPSGTLAQLLETHVDDGRTVLFMPPDAPDETELFGTKWTDWVEPSTQEPFRANTWRDDAGLLAKTQSGMALPVGELQVYRYCKLDGPEVHLASFAGGDALLTRVATDRGGVYFLATLSKSSYSTLATDGVVYYVMLHRAIADGASALSTARSITVGQELATSASEWDPLNKETDDRLSSERPYSAGVFRNNELLFALNRNTDEDIAKPMDAATLEPLLGGLDYQRIEDQVGDESSLASEIWRVFLIVMAAGMILEAALCIPSREQSSTSNLFSPSSAQR